MQVFFFREVLVCVSFPSSFGRAASVCLCFQSLPCIPGAVGERFPRWQPQEKLSWVELPIQLCGFPVSFPSPFLVPVAHPGQSWSHSAEGDLDDFLATGTSRSLPAFFGCVCGLPAIQIFFFSLRSGGQPTFRMFFHFIAPSFHFTPLPV